MPDDEEIVVRGLDGILTRRNGGRFNDIWPAVCEVGVFGKRFGWKGDIESKFCCTLKMLLGCMGLFIDK